MCDTLGLKDCLSVLVARSKEVEEGVSAGQGSPVVGDSCLTRISLAGRNQKVFWLAGSMVERKTSNLKAAGSSPASI